MNGTDSDPALHFWLRYAERQGALVEPAQEGSLVVLPEQLQRSLSLPEEVMVTSDPEVAEEGALLLAPGHPALERAAQEVLEARDVAYGIPGWPPMPPPSGLELLEQARADISVDHGKFELDGAPEAIRLPVLRLGALVTYSLDRPVQESEEVWVDGHASLALEDAVRQAVEDSGSSGGGRPTEPCLEPDLLRALQVADRLLEERVEARMVRLRREARGLREDERARVEAYYEAVLDSIAERRDRSGAERRALYEAQAEAAQTERARRLQEIEDKHQPRSDRQPFRLHLLLVPAYRLPVQVRRGPRAYPYALVWLPILRRFLPARCPACGERAILVAGRKGLGCAACVAQRTEAVPPTPAPEPAVASEVPAREPAPAERDDDWQQNRNLPPGAPSAPDKAPPGQLRLDLRSEGKLPAMSPPPPPTRRRPSPRETGARSKTNPEAEGSEIRGDDDVDLDRFFADYRAQARQVLRIGDELAFDFWQRVGDRKPWRRVVRDSPLAALYRLYGPVGPLYAVGVPKGQVPERVSAWSGNLDGQGARTSWGTLVCGRQTFPFAIRWKPVDRRHAAISEVVPSRDDDEVLALLQQSAEPAAEPNLRCPPKPACRLDEVGASLWRVALPTVGLPVVVRCLAAWWRPAVQEAASGLPAATVAAALVYIVTRHLPLRPLKDQVAQSHGIATAALTRAQRRLEGALGAGR